jgi:hypothetical protein
MRWNCSARRRSPRPLRSGSPGRTRTGDPGDPGYNDNAELGFRFHPRLNPLARALALIFRRGAEQVTVELRLP